MLHSIEEFLSVHKEVIGVFHYRLVKIDEVIAQQSFTHKEEFRDIPIIQGESPKPHRLLPEGSHLDTDRSQLEISIHSCKIKSMVPTRKYNLFEVETLFIVQKELVIQRLELKPLELEFLFRRSFKKVIKQKKKSLTHQRPRAISSVI